MPRKYVNFMGAAELVMPAKAFHQPVFLTWDSRKVKS